VPDILGICKFYILFGKLTPEDIAEIVAHWTGIPVARMVETEAEKLAQDPRLEAVHQPPNPRSKVLHNTVQTPKAYNQTLGNFARNSNTDQTSMMYNVNWGLRRTSLPGPEVTIGNTYFYEADGTGVDPAKPALAGPLQTGTRRWSPSRWL